MANPIKEEAMNDVCAKYGFERPTQDYRAGGVYGSIPEESEIRLAMTFTQSPAFLPILEETLMAASDEDLTDVHTETNALMWAASGWLTAEKLRMLRRCRPEWVASHIRCTDKGGWTPLHYLAVGADDNPDSVALLAEWGADINARSKTDGRSALHDHAACNTNDRNEQRIRALLSCNPAIYQDFQGNTPSFYEWKYGHGDRERIISDYEGAWYAEQRKTDEYRRKPEK
jgi:hypothetical protein